MGPQENAERNGMTYILNCRPLYLISILNCLPAHPTELEPDMGPVRGGADLWRPARPRPGQQRAQAQGQHRHGQDGQQRRLRVHQQDALLCKIDTNSQIWLKKRVWKYLVPWQQGICHCLLAGLRKQLKKLFYSVLRTDIFWAMRIA